MPFSLYAKGQMLLLSIGAATAPASWQVALYTASANPTGPPTEVTTTGYARQAVTLVQVTSSSGAILTNQADITWNGMSATTFQGAAVLDDSGNIWFWWDQPSPVTTPDGAPVTVPATDLAIEVVT